ncbi:helix-turn-helix domain-containing protein [Nocardiopsis sp. NPDC058631]|uniref:helix-turn-helix domain-containing protein n=1 Tax=Nocardiopsis sp. NPDC058631 TaxID=3346566 RepID=UPI003660A400
MSTVKRSGAGPVGGGQDSAALGWERFGRRVGELREAAGLSAQDLVVREVCEASELRRVEEGGSAVPRHLAEYLDRKLNAQGSLVNAWARSTLNTHLESGARPHELDSSVSSLREFHPGALPTTVQTYAYATALGRVRGKPTGQSIGWNRTASLRVVVNEAAVRTPVGGAKVMREQLSRIIGSMRDSGLCLQVIPADVAEHPCPMGPFRLLSLGSVYTVAHLVSPCGDGQLISAPQEARAFADLFEDLRGAALPVSDSLDLVVHICESLRSGSDRKAITSGDRAGDGVLPAPPTSVNQTAR